MKKFTVKATALALASVCGSAAFAGTITAPASATKYAVEALTSATSVTVPSIVYRMGVGRPYGNGFTVLFTPSSGQFGTCPTTLVYAAAGVAAAPGITLKRGGATECVYDVQLNNAGNTNPMLVNDTLELVNLPLVNHGLSVAGATVSVTVALKDPGETSFVDNSGSLSKAVATSVQSINIFANGSDTATTADVNATAGPLKGFVAGGAAPADTATIAKFNLTFDNNSANAKAADGTTNFNFAGTNGTAAITLTGPTFGLKANNFCIDLDDDATLCETGEVFNASSSAATLTGIASTTFPAQGLTATHTVTFAADGTTSLGTGRTFALTGSITPQVGAVEALADTASKNATAWVWTANASQLVAPYMSTNAKYVTRFQLLNTGSTAVGYSVQCYAEGSNVATNGAGGNLKASGTTVINASDACSFSDATMPRGAAIFTINAPIGTVKGVYNIVDAATGANGFVPMVRPYNGNTTE